LTVVEGEHSLMLDEAQARTLPEQAVAILEDRWKILKVYEGPAANGPLSSYHY